MTLRISRARQNLGLDRNGARGVGALPPGLHTQMLRAPAAAMHPVASVGVPQAILASTGRALSPSERASWASKYMSIALPVDSTIDAPTGVVAGASLQMKPSSQVTIWITDFTVDTDEPCDFTITQLKISRVDQIAGAGGVPSSRYRQNSHRPQINNEILAGGSFALVEVKNINKTQTLDFHGSFDGLDLSKPLAQSL